MLLVAAPSFAASAFVGTVVDSESKKPLAETTVHATSSNLQGERTAATDASGSYRLGELPPGIYTLRFSREGHEPLVRKDVQLRLMRTVRVNAELKAGASDVSATARSVPASWSAGVYSQEKFRAAFPTKPKVERTADETEAGTAESVTYSVSLSDGSYLAIAVSKFPDGAMKNALPAKVLEGARDGALANVNGEAMGDRTILVDAPKGDKRRKYPGREFEAKVPNGMRVAMRVILVGDRLYQLMHVRMNEDREIFEQLVSSFELLP